MIPTPNAEGGKKKPKKSSSSGRQSSFKYAQRHGYTSKSNPRRRNGRWVANRNAK